MYLSLSLIHSYHNNKMAFSSSSSLCLSYGYGYLRLPTTTRTRKRSANPKAGSSRSLQAKAASTSPSTFTSLRTSNVRLDLLLAISIQGALRSQQVLRDFTAEARNFLSFREGQPRSLEEALMTVPNLETTPYRILLKNDAYEIREYESYLVAETEMAGQSAFGFFASSQAFNTLASYLFGKVTNNLLYMLWIPNWRLRALNCLLVSNFMNPKLLLHHEKRLESESLIEAYVRFHWFLFIMHLVVDS
ncbi:hypothetical protein O6H91_11G100100 [Diphasiastrum complanatum]|uniref:Uncharacterized protein n=1 Tax=Diphasiastrum complanatum TaxID=34168 RepID=A0ACC2CC93_DIPCM|nr:hypothetical protein O6H91_11G100100 [Diphasiastrum complanatum]